MYFLYCHEFPNIIYGNLAITPIITFIQLSLVLKLFFFEATESYCRKTFFDSFLKSSLNVEALKGMCQEEPFGRPYVD